MTVGTRPRACFNDHEIFLPLTGHCAKMFIMVNVSLD